MLATDGNSCVDIGKAMRMIIFWWVQNIFRVNSTVDSLWLEPSGKIEKGSSYQEFEANNRKWGNRQMDEERM